MLMLRQNILGITPESARASMGLPLQNLTGGTQTVAFSPPTTSAPTMRDGGAGRSGPDGTIIVEHQTYQPPIDPPMLRRPAATGGDITTELVDPPFDGNQHMVANVTPDATAPVNPDAVTALLDAWNEQLRRLARPRAESADIDRSVTSMEVDWSTALGDTTHADLDRMSVLLTSLQSLADQVTGDQSAGSADVTASGATITGNPRRNSTGLGTLIIIAILAVVAYKAFS